MLIRPTWAIMALPWAIILCGLSSQAAYSQGLTISYSPEGQRAIAGVPFHVTYEARWRGPANAYALLPPEPERVPWGSARLMESTTASVDGVQVVRFVVQFVAEEPGTVDVPPYVVSYYGSEAFDRVESGEATAATDTREAERERHTLRASGFAIPVHRPFPFGAAVIAALLAGLLAIGGVTYMRKRGRRPRSAIGGPSAAQTVQAALNAARQYRLDGRMYEYYRELARGATLLAPSVAARKLREKLEQDAERVGYGALHPSDDELEGAARDLELALREQSRGED